MIFEHGNSPSEVPASWYIGDTLQTYRCTPTVCLNPICDCQEIFLRFERPGESYNVGFDLAEKRIIERDQSATDNDFTFQFSGALDDSDYKILNKFYLFYKRLSCETADYSKLSANLSEFKPNEHLVPYNHVLHYASTFDITINGNHYAIEECYCLKKRCPCFETVLCFYPVLNQDADEYTLAEVGDLVTAIRVDYQSKKWRLDQDSNYDNLFEVSEAQRTLENQYTNLYKTLKEHHHRLRLLYNNYLNTLPLPEKSQKIGRNDPCPCGSGKKFKKCCE